MSQAEIFAEVRSVFADMMNNEMDFPFKFLQGTGKGCKSLTCPSLSSKFQWDAKQVNSLGEKCIYVLAEKELTLREEEFIKVESSGESSDENRHPKRRRNSSPPLPPSGILPHQDNHSNTPHQDHGRSNTPHPNTPHQGGHVCVQEQQNMNTPSALHTQLSEEYREYCVLMDSEKGDDIIDSEEEQEVQEAIMQSFGTVKSVGREDLETFKLILDTHRRKEISQAEDDNFDPVVFSRIHVLRSELWKSALNCFRRASFDVSKPIKIVFVGEPCEDQGGPLREFFTLLLQEMVTKSGLFEGALDNAALAHDALALQRKDYEIVGKMIATSICHGGPAPHSFSPVLAEMIVFGHVKSDVSVNDIPDAYVRESLKKVDECQNDEAIEKLMLSDELSFRFDCGYTKANVTVADKKELFRSIALHYLVYRVHGEIEQIKKGMRETLRFGRLMDVYCDIIYSLLIPKKCPLSATQLQDLFKANFSEAGSNNKALEDKVLYFFMEYIKDTEDKQTCTNLEDILLFVTGARVEPPIGFDNKLIVSFTSEERLPAANTCALSITFYRKYKDYAHFKERMDFAVRNSHGFGLI